MKPERQCESAERGPGYCVPIRRWPEEERPRELLFSRGAQSLPLSTLFAVILRTGKRGINAEELSRRVLDRFSGLRGIDVASISDIRDIEGIGPAKAAQIKAALEIGKRLIRDEAKSRGRIDSPGKILEYVSAVLGPYLREKHVEALHVILLDRKRRPIREVELCRGSIDSVDVDPGRILAEALRSSASSLVLVHNHPSGDGIPSQKDISFTYEIRDACGLFGIRLLDHIIIGENPSRDGSFVTRGLL